MRNRLGMLAIALVLASGCSSPDGEETEPVVQIELDAGVEDTSVTERDSTDLSTRRDALPDGGAEAAASDVRRDMTHHRSTDTDLPDIVHDGEADVGILLPEDGCAPGEECAYGPSCGAYDGTKGLVCNCDPATDTYECGDWGAVTQGCPEEASFEECVARGAQALCVETGPSGCEMDACDGENGGWRGGCNIVCPEYAYCGSRCPLGSETTCECLDRDSGDPAGPCTCLDVGGGMGFWFCQ